VPFNIARIQILIYLVFAQNIAECSSKTTLTPAPEPSPGCNSQHLPIITKFIVFNKPTPLSKNSSMIYSHKQALKKTCPINIQPIKYHQTVSKAILPNYKSTGFSLLRLESRVRSLTNRSISSQVEILMKIVLTKRIISNKKCKFNTIMKARTKTVL
jgi:hypothetical protein